MASIVFWRSAIWLCMSLTRPIRSSMSARSSSRVSNSELSAAHSSVVSGSFLTLTSFTSTRKATVASGSFGLAASKARMAPALAPCSSASSSGTTEPDADLVEIVVDADHLRARGVGAVQVDGHEVAVDGGAIDHLELGVVLAQAVDLVLHLFVLHGEPGQGDLQSVVAGDGDERPDLDHGVEGDGAGVLAARDVDLGLRDRVEFGVDHGACVEVGQRLAQRLGAQRAGAAHARLEHLARHLAGPEPRHAHLAGERPHDVAQGTIELGLVDLDAQADEVAFHWLCGGTHHEPTTLPGGPGHERTRPASPVRDSARRVGVRPDASSEHEVHGAEHLVPHGLVTLHDDAVARCADAAVGQYVRCWAADRAAVIRPQPRRTKSRLESDSVTVGTTVVVDGSGPAGLDGDGEGAGVVPGAGDLEAHRGPVGAGRLLAHDEGHGALAPASSDMADARFPPPPGRSSARRTSCSCTQLSKTRTSMKTAWGRCPTGLQPTAAHCSSESPASWASRVLVTSTNSARTSGPGRGPAHGDEGLVARGEVVLHVVAECAVPRRCGLAHDGALDPDQVRELVLDVPAGALGRQGPLGASTARSRRRPGSPRSP